MDSLDERYLRDGGTVYLTGIQAIVRSVRDRALLDRRLGRLTGSYVTGYEGSPLGGLDLEFARSARLLADLGIVHADAVNEELAATAVSGTQLLGQLGTPERYEGVTGYFYGKSPGLDRASDAIRHANLMGTHPLGGAVALIGDDPPGKSSTIPGVCEAALADLRVPTLYPADAGEVLTLTRHAAYLSRHTGTWSAVKIVSSVADGARTVRLSPDDRADPLAGLAPNPHTPRPRMVGPMLLDLEESLVTRRLPRAWEFTRAHRLDRIDAGPSDRIGILAAGATALAVTDALLQMGLDETARRRRGIRLGRLALVWPLDVEVARAFARGLDEIVVVEEKRPFLADQLMAALYGMPDAPRIVGKTDERGNPLVSPVAELDTDRVAAVLARRLGEEHGVPEAQRWAAEPHGGAAPGSPALLPLAARTPYFCSGCPHNTSTLSPDGALIGGGIGCHTLVLMVDESRVGHYTGITQMGGEGAQWLGLRHFVAEDHFLQNIGDGTLTHSGSLAIRAAVDAGANITYKILYNHAVAMTGGQDPAGGFSLDRLVRLLLAEGVARVAITTDDPVRTRAHDLPRDVAVRPREDIVALQRDLAQTPGVTVLIHDQPCATELRRRRTRGTAPPPAHRIMIDERICEGCGDCAAASNCLSVRPVETEYGQKRRIHQSSCVVDATCVRGDCPSFLRVTIGARPPATAPELAGDDLPEPPGHASQEPARNDLSEPPGHSSQEPAVDAQGAEVTSAEATSRESASAEGTDFALRITGIGGAGVVTAAQILATAATIAGRSVRAVHQTGLAQKGGAVVSDVRLTDADTPGKVPAGGADLFIAADALVAADPAYLTAASPERTLLLQNTARVPTGQMVLDGARPYPGAQVDARLAAASARRIPLDAATLTVDLFGDEQPAILLMLGAAYQLGALPISATALERAIALNGAGRHVNTQAFRRGRQFVADPGGLRRTLAALRVGSQSVEPQCVEPQCVEPGPVEHRPADLDSLVEARARDLSDYQDERYAQRYRALVATVRDAEADAVPGEHALAEAVARYAYKLMAFKDEYEVARLLLDDEVPARVAREFGPDATYEVLLHPPALRALGATSKIPFGPRSRTLWRGLHAVRRLRGTIADPFGHTRVRRVERALITEYEDVVRLLLSGLTPHTHEGAVEIASLPDLVRGYEQVKLEAVTRYRHELRRALRAYPLRTTRQPTPGG